MIEVGNGIFLLIRRVHFGSTKGFSKICTKLCGRRDSGVIRESTCVEVQAVGAGAANQAIKAVAVARGYLAPSGIDLVCVPAFANVTIDGEERTAIKLIVEQR